MARVNLHKPELMFHRHLLMPKARLRDNPRVSTRDIIGISKLQEFPRVKGIVAKGPEVRKEEKVLRRVSITHR